MLLASPSKVAGVKILELWRYPVKSMQGERIDASEVGKLGLEGDRAWALIDEETGKVVSAKSPRRWPDIFDYRASYTDGPAAGVAISLPGGGQANSGDRDVDQALSAALGRRVRLTNTAPAKAKIESYSPDIEGVDGGGTTGETRIAYAAPGTFFDFSPIHLLTTSTLEALRAARPEAQFDIRRFRPNILVDTDGEQGFVENDWVGKTLLAGDALRLKIVLACPRCVMTTLAQPGLPPDPAVLRTVARANSVHIAPLNASLPSVGVYATVEAPGPIRLDAGVTLA
jgi:uncharacterized protein YcbX